MSDPSTPWMIAAYVFAIAMFGGYALRLVVATRRAKDKRK